MSYRDLRSKFQILYGNNLRLNDIGIFAVWKKVLNKSCLDCSKTLNQFWLDFSEAMRALGFPQQISLESFRNPNWDLVEECLRWLAARIEPDATLAGGKDSVEQRVAMVTHAIELFVSINICLCIYQNLYYVYRYIGRYL